MSNSVAKLHLKDVGAKKMFQKMVFGVFCLPGNFHFIFYNKYQMHYLFLLFMAAENIKISDFKGTYTVFSLKCLFFYLPYLVLDTG